MVLTVAFGHTAFSQKVGVSVSVTSVSANVKCARLLISRAEVFDGVPVENFLDDILGGSSGHSKSLLAKDTLIAGLKSHLVQVVVSKCTGPSDPTNYCGLFMDKYKIQQPLQLPLPHLHGIAHGDKIQPAPRRTKLTESVLALSNVRHSCDRIKNCAECTTFLRSWIGICNYWVHTN